MVGESAALAGFHDDDRNVSVRKNLIELAGMDQRIIPVSVVQLDLYELDLRVAVYDLNEELRCAVIRETEVPDLALFPLLDTPVEAVVFTICIVVVAVFNAVKEIVIEVVDAASFELLIKDLVPVFERMD